MFLLLYIKSLDLQDLSRNKKGPKSKPWGTPNQITIVTVRRISKIATTEITFTVDHIYIIRAEVFCKKKLHHSALKVTSHQYGQAQDNINKPVKYFHPLLFWFIAGPTSVCSYAQHKHATTIRPALLPCADPRCCRGKDFIQRGTKLRSPLFYHILPPHSYLAPECALPRSPFVSWGGCFTPHTL